MSVKTEKRTCAVCGEVVKDNQEHINLPTDKFLRRLKRWLSWPGDKNERFWRRVECWQLFIFSRNRQLNHNEYVEIRKVQIGIQRWNRQNSEGD